MDQVYLFDLSVEKSDIHLPEKFAAWFEGRVRHDQHSASVRFVQLWWVF